MNKHFSWSTMLAIAISAGFAIISLIGVRQSPDLIWSALFFGVCTVILLLTPFLHRWLPSKALRVEYDSDTIRTCSGKASVASIRWDEVDEIAVFTSASGPLGEDVVWMVTDATRAKRLMITGDAPGFVALLPEFQRLPGFDHSMLLEAMGSVTTGCFVVWRRARE